MEKYDDPAEVFTLACVIKGRFECGPTQTSLHKHKRIGGSRACTDQMGSHVINPHAPVYLFLTSPDRLHIKVKAMNTKCLSAKTLSLDKPLYVKNYA